MAKKKKYFQIVGQKLTNDTVKNLQLPVSEYREIGLPQQCSTCVNDGKEFAYCRHLGYRDDPDDCRLFQEILERVGDFWECSPKTFEFWDRAFARSMLFTLLMEDKARFKKIANWATPQRKPQPNHAVPDETQQLYLIVASYFHEKPAPKFSMMLNAILANRNKEIRCHAKLVEAIRDGNQEEFEAQVLACIECQRKKPTPKPTATYMQDWMPMHANAFYLAGLLKGMKDPKFPPDVMAYLMTPESVGLAKKK